MQDFLVVAQIFPLDATTFPSIVVETETYVHGGVKLITNWLGLIESNVVWALPTLAKSGYRLIPDL